MIVKGKLAKIMLVVAILLFILVVAISINVARKDRKIQVDEQAVSDTK